jgi:lipopolysaccharide export system protein LptA
MMREWLLSVGVVAALTFPVSVNAAAAQQPASQPNALQGFSQNRNLPVKINAMSLEVRDKQKVATYSGSVVLVQGDTTMRCKTLIVYYDGDQSSGPTVRAATPGPTGSQQIRRIEAIGDVIVTQKDQTATGDKAVYDMKEDTVRLFPTGPNGLVTVTQGPNIVRGPRLTVNLATGVSHFEGNGRVESLIVPGAMKGDNHTAPAAHPAPGQHAPPKAHATNP